jgi:hypothetical protein
MGISRPFSIGVVILTWVLLITCSVAGALAQSPWFLFTAVALLEVVFGVNWIAYEDYKMLNDDVLSNRRRERERNANAARRHSGLISAG